MRRQPGQGNLVIVNLGYGKISGWIRVNGREGNVRFAQKSVTQGIQLKRKNKTSFNEGFDVLDIGLFQCYQDILLIIQISLK